MRRGSKDSDLRMIDELVELGDQDSNLDINEIKLGEMVKESSSIAQRGFDT